MAEIIVGKLHGELVDAGLDILGVNSNPTIHWASPPSGAQQATAQAVIAAHDPTPIEYANNLHKLKRLGKLLIQKGFITQAEGLAILELLKQGDDE